MSSLDCLIIGFYDYPFPEYVSMLKAMGADAGAYHDVSLAFVEHEGEPMRALDILTHFHFEGRSTPSRPFHNADFLWPVVYYLTSYLSRRGYEVDYVNLPHLEMEQLKQKLEQPVSAVAITTTLYVSPQPILALVATIRKYREDVKIIVGGPYISNLMDSTSYDDLSQMFEYLGADIYVMSKEGEATLANVLQALRNGAELERVANIAFRNAEDVFTITRQEPEANALEENIVDFTAFGDQALSEFLSLRTAKSCPFACAFCGFPERAGAYRFLDVAAVEKQLNHVAEVGTVTTLTFLDDTFNVPKARFKAILRMMIRNDYTFRWNCFYRADQGDEETIELMARAGCEGVFLGVESGNDEMLRRMNKTARRKHYVEAIPLLRKAGISTYASLIIGYPGETKETVRDTINFLEETCPDFFRAQLWYADPVTPVWKRREELRLTGAGFNWTHGTMTAREACKWIERMFLEVNNSVWLPQFGFEQWSTFYLSRKGMSWPQIKTFVTCFNNLIKFRLTNSDEGRAEDLWEKLRQSCQFDRAEATGTPESERWAGAAYRRAMAALAKEFADRPDLSLPATREDVARPACGEFNDVALQMWTNPGADVRAEDCLAVFALATAEVDRVEPLLVYLDEFDRMPVPVRFQLSVHSELSEWRRLAERKLLSLLPHRHLALSICTNCLWLEQNHIPPVSFRFAFHWQTNPAETDLKDLTARELGDGVVEVLEAHWVDQRLSLCLKRRETLISHSTANKKLARIMTLLEALVEQIKVDRVIEGADNRVTISRERLSTFAVS